MTKEPIKGLHYLYAVAQRDKMNLAGIPFPMTVQNIWKDRYTGADSDGYIIFDNEIIHRTQRGSGKAFEIAKNWMERNVKEDKKNILKLFVPSDTDLNDLADIVRAAQLYDVHIEISVWQTSNAATGFWIQHPCP